MRSLVAQALLILGYALPVSHAIASNTGLPYAPPAPSKILVTGAAGRTGKIVFSKLMQDSRYDPIALVRTEQSGKKFRNAVKCGLEHVVVCDVTKMNPEETLPGLNGAKAIIICTSAVPQISKLSLFKAFCKVPFNMLRGKKAVDFRSFRFKFKPGQYPEKVDYEGQVAQIDLAKKMGIPHVVVVSSMGGTDPTNFLNAVGKKPDGSGNGDILLWKRKAERYLVQCGLRYSIIHPGGLVDTPGGVEELILDVNDKLLETKKRSISRSDVANLCVAALDTYQSVSFDCITRAVEEGTQVPSAKDALNAFLKRNETANYSL